jgi:hypothetical protein
MFSYAKIVKNSSTSLVVTPTDRPENCVMLDGFQFATDPPNVVVLCDGGLASDGVGVVGKR